MKKKINAMLMFFRALHILFLVSFYQVSCFAQVNIPEYIRAKFNDYCNSVPGEEVYVHTDRDDYVSGEDMWFSIYLFDRMSVSASSAASIAYFEILDPRNKPVVRKRVLLENGTGAGHIVLPDTLRSGVYTIVAYTSWMRNFLPWNCFYREINVYNAAGRISFIRSRKTADLKNMGTFKAPVDRGITLDADNLSSDSLKLFITTNEAYRNENNGSVFVFIQSHGKIIRFSSETLERYITGISISKDLLPSGISQITIFDTKGPSCERFVFKYPDKKQNIIINSPDSCLKRQKMILSIQGGEGSAVVLNKMSVAVSLSSGRNDFSDIDDYLVFGTEFGLFPRTLPGVQKLTELAPGAMDSLMQTLNSNWINWEKVFSDDARFFRYPHERNCHYILGKLLTENNQTGWNENLLMSSLGGEPDFQYTTTDSYGNFNFELRIDESINDLIIQPEVMKTDSRLVLESSFQNFNISEGLMIRPSSRYQGRRPGTSLSERSLAHRLILKPLPAFLNSPNQKDSMAGRTLL